MSPTITCNFARVAVRKLTQKHRQRDKHLPRGKLQNVLADYNVQFSSCPKLQTDYMVAAKTFAAIDKMFLRKWSPPQNRVKYLQTFSEDAWQKLSAADQQHALTNCTACQTKHPDLTETFPSLRNQRKKKPTRLSTPVIAVNPCKDMPPKEFAKQAVADLTTICQETYGCSFGEIIEQTTSGLQKKVSPQERQQTKRKILRDTRNQMQDKMNDTASDMVLGNRISWRTYDKLRKTMGLQNQPIENKQKRSHPECDQTPTPKRKTHSYTLAHLESVIDTQGLHTEATTWTPNQAVNWSKLGTKYGLTVPNRGQIIKEYLQGLEIPAAMTPSTSYTPHRRARSKFTGGRVSFPIPRPARKERKKVKLRIESGEINTGEPILSTEQHSFRVDRVIQLLKQPSQ